MFKGLVETSPCPICGNDTEVFEWLCGNDDCLVAEHACIKCAMEHHFMHHPENRPRGRT